MSACAYHSLLPALQGLAVFFQFLLALCRFKSDTDYDTHCAGALCGGGCVAGQGESN